MSTKNIPFSISGTPRAKQDAEPKASPLQTPPAPPASSDLAALKTAGGKFAEPPTTQEAHDRRKTMPPPASGPKPKWLKHP